MVTQAHHVLSWWRFTALGVLCALLSALRIECRSLLDAGGEPVRPAKLSDYTATDCTRVSDTLRVYVLAATGP